jgi:long-chain acyl-CoA synthetase
MPDSVAFRSKQFGIYRERCWQDYAALVAQYARALQSLGLERGERAAIMGDVCEEWMLCDLAVQSLGAIAYGIYPTASPAEVDYQMRDGGASIFIAENQEYIDKILSIADRLPDLRAIVVIDDSAMFGYAHPKLRRLRELLDNSDEPDLEWLEARTATLSPEDPAFIVYTSGTTGHPKGALVSPSSRSWCRISEKIRRILPPRCSRSRRQRYSPSRAICRNSPRMSSSACSIRADSSEPLTMPRCASHAIMSAGDGMAERLPHEKRFTARCKL